jgi:hypothetical protein
MGLSERRDAGRLHEIQDRRHEIDVLNQIRDPPAGAGVAFLLDDQRDVDRFVVHEETVLLLAVVAQPFSVIGEQDDCGAIVELMRLQVLHEAPDDFVRVRDFAVVRRVGGEAIRRRVWLVRLVQVEEQERARRAD